MPDNKGRMPAFGRKAGKLATAAARFVWLRAILRRLLQRGARRVRRRPVSHLSRHLLRDMGGEELQRLRDIEDAGRRRWP